MADEMVDGLRAALREAGLALGREMAATARAEAEAKAARAALKRAVTKAVADDLREQVRMANERADTAERNAAAQAAAAAVAARQIQATCDNWRVEAESLRVQLNDLRECLADAQRAAREGKEAAGAMAALQAEAAAYREQRDRAYADLWAAKHPPAPAPAPVVEVAQLDDLGQMLMALGASEGGARSGDGLVKIGEGCVWTINGAARGAKGDDAVEVAITSQCDAILLCAAEGPDAITATRRALAKTWYEPRLREAHGRLLAMFSEWDAKVTPCEPESPDDLQSMLMALGARDGDDSYFAQGVEIGESCAWRFRGSDGGVMCDDACHVDIHEGAWLMCEAYGPNAIEATRRALAKPCHTPSCREAHGRLLAAFLDWDTGPKPSMSGRRAR